MSKSAGELETEVRLALSGCAVDARGLWHEMRYLIEQHSDRPGHLQRNGRPVFSPQLALVAGCAPEHVARLLQELVDVGLIERSGETWCSPVLARVAHQRAAGARRVRTHREKRGRTSGALCNAPCSAPGNATCNADVTADSPPPSSPSPGPPPPIPPTTLSFSAKTTGPIGPATGTRLAVSTDESTAELPTGIPTRRPAQRRHRVLTDAQNAVRTAFIAWWCNQAYPQHMGGVVYAFEAEGARNGSAAGKILVAAKYELDVAKSICIAYLRADDTFVARRNRPLFGIAEQLTTWVMQANGARATLRGDPYGRSRPGGKRLTAAQRGEYAEPVREIKTLTLSDIPGRSTRHDAGAIGIH